jgi:PAS domain S-box-containing protein
MAKTHIMVVEDESIVAEDIKRSLQSIGYEVAAVVSSGEKAVEKADEIRPDLVLMDIVLMGKMNGIEAAGRIRSAFNIPVIYLTAYSDEEILERAKITEPFGYIIKPFDDRELHSVIEMSLYKHGMEKKLKENQEWLATVLRSIGDAVIATDTKGSVMFMNTVAENLTGYKQEEAIDKDIEEIFNIINEGTMEKVGNPIQKVLEKGVVVGLANHTVLIAKDGTEIPIDDSAAPIRDAKGALIGVVLAFHDISDRRQMENDLKEKLEDLEKFYNLAVNRELKMKELKEETEKLKSELNHIKNNREV